MITLDVDLFGLDDVTKRLFFVTQEMDRKIPGAINQVCQAGAEMVAGYAPTLTYALQGSIDYSDAVQTGEG